MAAKVMKAVQYFGYGGGAAALKVSFFIPFFFYDLYYESILHLDMYSCWMSA